ncbi:MAG: hypothetical protein VX498_14480, partial [Myxococcota bacterium]|nr:hypothetical protein [Myxococcota bacterium]
RHGAGERVGADQLVGLSVRQTEGAVRSISFGDHIPEGYEAMTPTIFADMLSPSSEPVEAQDEEQGEGAELDALDRFFETPGEGGGTDQADGEPVRALPPGAALRARLEAKAGKDRQASPPRVTMDSLAMDSLRRRAAVQSLELALADDRIVLEGQLRPTTVQAIRKGIERQAATLGESPRLYAPENLSLLRDFRILVGLRYVIELARRSGVRSPIEPVLSLPLGSSDITLLEAAQLYQAMLTGSSYRFYPSFLDSALALEEADIDPRTLESPYDDRRGDLLPDAQIIERIQLADGTEVYRAVRDRLPLQGSELSGELGAMLRRVVSHGTGRRAEGQVRPVSDDPRRAKRLRSLGVRMPLFGKTGTTNSYRNAAFVGMIPGLPSDGDELSWGHGQVVASYVGYDDNREMRRGGIRIAGASGSLPVWLGVARSVVESEKLGDRVDLVDLAFSGDKLLPLRWPAGFQAVPVDAQTGLPVAQDLPDAGTPVTVHRPAGERRFEPFSLLPPVEAP